jgi:hypothetical protein
MNRLATVALAATALCLAPATALAEGGGRPDVLPSIERSLQAHFDFEHPFPGNPALEQDQGRSGTAIELVNGGAAMRVLDGGDHVLQTQQVNPTTGGNDDWKAGIFSAAGVPTLDAFSGAGETTIMGWFKTTGTNPNLNSNTASPNDFFNAVGLAGILSGDSDGHAVRALLELIVVQGELRVVALARRVDGGSSQTFAASAPWQTILPQGQWVFLAATFDFDEGTMALYKNGKPLDGFYAVAGDPWGVSGPPEPDLTSEAEPHGIKIGGSFPQNTREQNPCNCRFDDLMFLDRVLTPGQIRAQHQLARWH